MRLILAALISLSFSVGAQTSLESDYEAQRRLLAEAAEKARMTKLIEKFNSIAKTYSQPTIDQVESRSEKGVVPGYESQFADGYSYIHYARLSDQTVCEVDRTRFPLLSLFNIEVIYNWQYQVMELNCADGRHFRLVEVQTQADIWDGLSPFPNQGPVIYELHTTY